ncbi:MAG: YraN family protein [Clostridium sp.]
MINNKQKGLLGEDKASEYLSSLGFDILDRNYRTKKGEIDIIACINEIVIFIEVKLRSSFKYGYPIEAINSKKVITIKSVAQDYIQSKNLWDYPVRFDVIEVFANEDYRINHTENAFY